MSQTILYGYSKQDLEKTVELVINKLQKAGSINGSEQSIENDQLSQREAAKFLNISITSLIRWKKEGKIPFYQIGKRIFFSKKELLEVAKKNRSLIKP